MKLRHLTSLLLLLQPLVFYCPIVSGKTLITPELINKIEKKHHGREKKRFIAWKKLILENANKPELTKLKLVNNFFNLFQYQSDANQVGRTDYWMTPIEFITKGRGDCEDFAIAKYFTLEAMHIATKKLRITYVKAVKYNMAHMVLTYYKEPSATPLVLDNLISGIKSADKRKDLLPVYSFNANGLWLARQRGQGRQVSGSDRISVWKDLNKRMIKQLDA